ncbi:inositol-polyphosphate 5-phosphatase, putative [Plasmodium ovale]|uniref:Inositol-polyphosphate 5-phosphatase, putative n=1 Tax=Plasmodium ovale TaxID=36330 RepID=A0A1D3TJ74_PLAOA|nr:inositol-polyphosphate 5-phosphatase, putative [Plasmodium ovale]
MISCPSLPSKKYYLESHGKYLSIVNIENNVKNILKINYFEDIKIVKEKEEYVGDNSEFGKDQKNRFWFFGCLGIIKSENTNFLVIVSDAEIVCYLFNRAIYRIKKISFIQLNEECASPNSCENCYQYEICSLAYNGRLYKINNNSKKGNKKFFCNKQLKTQNYFDSVFHSSNFFFENFVSKYSKLYYNETYIHKFKNGTLKQETLKALTCFLHAFNKGPFYFSYYYNLTGSLQRNYINESEKRNKKIKSKTHATNSSQFQDDNNLFSKNATEAVPIFDKLQFKEINEEYTWNWKLLANFMKIDGFDFVVFLIHGYINSNILYINNNEITLYLISRKNKNRSGVRFWCRGGNEKGDVANFVETEQIVICKNTEKTNVFSYILVRGSIPVLWKQQPTLSIRPKINICADMNENTQILNLHMEKLKNIYGKISITNLINKKFGEKYLGQCFEKCLKSCSVQHNYTWFDFHSEFNKLNLQTLHRSLKTVVDDLNDFSHFSFSISNSMNYNLHHGEAFPSWSSVKIDNFQKGVFRVNCIDCLDRTNVFQSFIAKYVLYLQLKSVHIELNEQKCFPFYFFKNTYDELVYRKIWIHNANAISIIYSGAGALKNDITQNGKRTIGGLFQDLCHILVRYINNNFFDGYNNDCINLATNTNIKYPKNFNMHKAKYNEIMKVFLEFMFIFSATACTSPMQRLLKGVYFFSHNLTSSMISQSINLVFFFLRKNFYLSLLPLNHVKYFNFLSILAKASGLVSTSFVVLLFFCVYVFTQRRRVISSPQLGAT